MRRKPTSIEKAMAELLKANSLRYKREHKIGRFPVDFYLVDHNLSIQCDGSFHHNNCYRCKKGTASLPRQVFQARRDKACMAYHRHAKVSIVRICECQINSDPDEVLILIQGAILQIKEGKKVFWDKK